VPELEGVEVALLVRGGARTGRATLGKSLSEYLRRSLGGLISAADLRRAQAKLRLKRRVKNSPKGLAAGGRLIGAEYVLYVSITRIGWKYRAQAIVVNTADGEVQMDFRSEYYKPQLEAGDRGVRIARTTVGKLTALVGQAVAVRPPATPADATPADTASADPKDTAPEAKPPAEPTEAPTATTEPTGADDAPTATADPPTSEPKNLDGAAGANDSLLAELGLLGEQVESGAPGEEDDSDIAAILHQVDVDGLVQLRVQYDAYAEGAASDYPVTSPNVFEVSVDTGPGMLRGYVEGRVAARFASTSTPTLGTNHRRAEAEVLLDQLWVEVNIDDALIVTVGRKHLEFGAGRFWRPTNVLAVGFRDPLAPYDHRVGSDLLAIRVPFDSIGLTLMAVGAVDDIAEPLDASATGRIAWASGRTELAAMVTGGRDQALQLGADLATGVGGFGVHLSAALMHGVREPRWTGDVRWAEQQWPTQESLRDDWLTRVAGGAAYAFEYGDADEVELGGEYMYNQAGYASADLYPWLIANGRFTPYYVGRHYAAIFLSVPSPGDWDGARFDLRGIGNLSDLSFRTQLDASAELLGSLDTSVSLRFDLQLAVSFGEPGEFRLPLDVPAVPGHPVLWAGLSRPAQVFSIGGGLSLGF